LEVVGEGIMREPQPQPLLMVVPGGEGQMEASPEAPLFNLQVQVEDMETMEADLAMVIVVQVEGVQKLWVATLLRVEAVQAVMVLTLEIHLVIFLA
jgi:hypothetical protein